jgi:hypothetical protein
MVNGLHIRGPTTCLPSRNRSDLSARGVERVLHSFSASSPIQPLCLYQFSHASPCKPVHHSSSTIGRSRIRASALPAPPPPRPDHPSIQCPIFIQGPIFTYTRPQSPRPIPPFPFPHSPSQHRSCRIVASCRNPASYGSFPPPTVPGSSGTHLPVALEARLAPSLACPSGTRPDPSCPGPVLTVLTPSCPDPFLS